MNCSPDIAPKGCTGIFYKPHKNYESMKRFHPSFSGMLSLLAAALLTACTSEPYDTSDTQTTRVHGDKTPKIMVYIETNDTNPLNAGDYLLPDGEPLLDMVEFFAANIHKRKVGLFDEPTLYLNPELAPLLEPDPADPTATGWYKYVKPLQAKGIKVLVTVIGDWQGIGLATMNSQQTTQFARILAHAVERYGLDGIGFSDHYSNASYSIQTSYGEIITKLRALMPPGKLITINDWGYTSTIDSAARACIDYAYHGNWSASFFVSQPGVGMDKSRWAPLAVNLGNINMINVLRSNSSKTAQLGFGAICNFNMRRSSERDPLPAFRAYAAGAYGLDVTCDGGNRPQDWTFVSGGRTLTIDDVPAE